MKISFENGACAEDIQNYVRTNLILSPTSTSSGSVVITVNGTTAD